MHVIEAKALKSIEKKLSADVLKEVELVKEEVYYVLNKTLDLYFLREFVKYYPCKLLREKAEVLLDTLLNYLMQEALKSIKNLDLDSQYEFFREELREKTKNRVLLKNGGFKPRPLKIKEDESFLDKALIAAPGIAVVAGGFAAAVAVPETSLLKAVPAVFSLVGPVYIVKKFKEKEERLKDLWKKQVSAYLKNAERDLKSWLLKAEKDFLNDLEEFYEKLAKSKSPSGELAKGKSPSSELAKSKSPSGELSEGKSPYGELEEGGLSQSGSFGHRDLRFSSKESRPSKVKKTNFDF